MLQKCKFIKNPKEDVIVDVEQMFSISNGIISVDIEEIREVISGADNVLILVGKGTGKNRVSNAVEDAVLHTCATAPSYDLFSADKVIVQLSYSDSHELLLIEASELIQFTEMFKSDTTFFWGISSSKTTTSSDITANIIAANIKQK